MHVQIHVCFCFRLHQFFAHEHEQWLVVQERIDAEAQTSPQQQAVRRPCAAAAVQTLPLPEPPEVSELRAQAAELQGELQRAVEALEQHVLQDQATRQQAAEAVATAEVAASEQVQAARKAADDLVAAARCYFLPFLLQ